MILTQTVKLLPDTDVSATEMPIDTGGTSNKDLAEYIAELKVWGAKGQSQLEALRNWIAEQRMKKPNDQQLVQ